MALLERARQSPHMQRATNAPRGGRVSTGVDGHRVRRHTNVRPTVDWLIREESGVDDIIDPRFFDPLRDMPVAEYKLRLWPYPPPRFPMVYTHARHFTAVWSIPVDQARALLPASPRIQPVRLTPDRAAFGVFAFDYRRSGLGAYRELGVAIPVIVDRDAPPLLPALVDAVAPGRYRGLGMFVLELPVDHDRACEGGIQLYGLPKVVGRADMSMREGHGHIRMVHERRLMAELDVQVKNRGFGKRMAMPLTTYSVLNGHLIETRYRNLSQGIVQPLGEARVTFGDHPKFARFQDLALSRRPLQVRMLHRMNWIVEEPKDLGAL